MPATTLTYVPSRGATAAEHLAVRRGRPKLMQTTLHPAFDPVLLDADPKVGRGAIDPVVRFVDGAAA